MCHITGDSMSLCNEQQFTTRDYDHDSWPHNCAIRFHGAWWYKACHLSNLNGDYLNGTHASYADGVNWKTFKDYHNSMKATEMKFRAHF